VIKQSLVALVAVVATCACARESPAPPAATDVVLRIETETIAALVPRNATLESLLRQHQLSAELVRAAVTSTSAVFDVRRLRAERPYRLVRSLDGILREFEYQIDANRFLRIVSRNRLVPAVLEAQVLAYEKKTDIVAIRGLIDADHPSLVAAMERTGENIRLAMALAGIFAGQIDFDNDLRPGDSFDVLFERSTRDGDFAGYGEILAAQLTADGRAHRAFRWANAGSTKAAYYDEEGRSLKRFMLRSPLQFDPRITSGFSRRRLHPVYRTYRAHLGVDYSAPSGAAVVAVANGVVESASWAGGGGNQVRIRHAGGYESYYLHLSAFAPGIRAGARVDQGQLIGRVGATGTATGPHLDYRLRRKGLFVNPLIEHGRMPPGDPIPEFQRAAFYSARDRLGHQLAATLSAEFRPPKPDAVRASR
jgi:murein DD-endopeptidase MepM/ murein hydrolase activator NlpD